MNAVTRTLRAFPGAGLLAVLLLLPACRERGAAGQPLVLAATVFPAVDIARRVAGPGVRVIQVLPAGASPHTFEPTPRQVRELQPARLIFKIGGIDDWVDPVAGSLPRASIVALDDGIVKLPFHGEDDGHGHREPGEESDPHYWLDAANAAIMARNVAAALAAADPGRASRYAENALAIARELNALHREIRDGLSPLKERRMIVFHDAWRYFAAAYGLEIAAVFQASPGREPAPRDLREMYALARGSGMRVIFSEPQLPVAGIEPLLRDLGLALVVLDPIGGTAPGDSYAALMRRNARAVSEALERRP